MFSPSQAFRLAAPMPPTPTAAMFSVLAGDCAPKTWRGAIAAATVAMAAVAANSRRVRVVGFDGWAMGLLSAHILPGARLLAQWHFDVCLRHLGRVFREDIRTCRSRGPFERELA